FVAYIAIIWLYKLSATERWNMEFIATDEWQKIEVKSGNVLHHHGRVYVLLDADRAPTPQEDELIINEPITVEETVTKPILFKDARMIWIRAKPLKQGNGSLASQQPSNEVIVTLI
ncbi:hypothetical protein PSI23_21620, partial [Xenorhabdus sp. XENO-10]